MSGGGVPLVLDVDLALRSRGCSAIVGDELGAATFSSGSLLSKKNRILKKYVYD